MVIKMIKIKEIPKKFIFKDGDVVNVRGVLKSGIGVIIDAFYPTKQPTGELSYTYHMSEPFPQLGVKFENGEKIHYNADDLIAGKVAKSKGKINQPRKLKDFLDNLTIDMEFENRGIVTLSECCNERIKEILAPLYDMEFYSNKYEEISLDEFDSFEYEFKSVGVGIMMRDSGQHAVTIRINVQGYDPTTLAIETGECF